MSSNGGSARHFRNVEAGNFRSKNDEYYARHKSQSQTLQWPERWTQSPGMKSWTTLANLQNSPGGSTQSPLARGPLHPPAPAVGEQIHSGSPASGSRASSGRTRGGDDRAPIASTTASASSPQRFEFSPTKAALAASRRSASATGAVGTRTVDWSKYAACSGAGGNGGGMPEWASSIPPALSESRSAPWLDTPHKISAEIGQRFKEAEKQIVVNRRIRCTEDRDFNDQSFHHPVSYRRTFV
eukprot:TRINITY_DN25565_c0_g2_i1.p1 TRINITY_DN25565_c0_g2~~TRINITY_DN25565_c0_g2_i1.p1  ORF type:complete len:241 (+),score=31.19 TRINITY_DN25565_c0_g2_i1:303-1025(+)